MSDEDLPRAPNSSPQSPLPLISFQPIGSRTNIPSDLPKSLIKIYNILYKKITNLIAGEKLSITKDASTIAILIENSMVLLEKAKDQETGEKIRGPEKKKYTLMMIKFIINDLTSKGRIEEETAEYLLSGIDFWGGIIIDIAVDAAKRVIDLGKDFSRDARDKGCGYACKNFWTCQ